MNPNVFVKIGLTFLSVLVMVEPEATDDVPARGRASASLGGLGWHGAAVEADEGSRGISRWDGT